MIIGKKYKESINIETMSSALKRRKKKYMKLQRMQIAVIVILAVCILYLGVSIVNKVTYNKITKGKTKEVICQHTATLRESDLATAGFDLALEEMDWGK